MASLTPKLTDPRALALVAETLAETLDADHARALRRAIRWEALTRAQHRRAIETLRELADHG